MGNTSIDDTNRDLPSKRKYGNIKFHGHKICEADSSKEKSEWFENHMFDEFVFDVDQDYRRYLTGHMMSIPTDEDCHGNGVNDDAVDNDPQYEIFLNSLTVHGNSFVLQVNEKNGLSEPLKYVVVDGSDDELDLDTRRKMKNIIGGNVGDDKFKSSSGSKLEAPIVFSSHPENEMRQFENDMKSEPVNSNPFGDRRCLIEELGNGGTYASDGKCKTTMHGVQRKSQILRKSRKVAKGGKSEAAANIKKKKDDECDDDYQVYCNYLSFDGNNLVLKYKNTSPIVYETDEYLENFKTNSSTYPVKETIKLPAQAGGSDASVKGDDNCLYLGSSLSRESHSTFRKQVMRILRKPFDSKGHQMLSQDIQARKPIARNMDLRFGREKSYTINKDGKSYLDHYYDLKRKLQAAKSSRKELNLLRGFFFWLQNLTQEGAFKPWQDASCLAL